MVIVTNTNKITKDRGYELINRFDKEGKVEKNERVLRFRSVISDNLPDYDEVTISTRWGSRKAFDDWAKSDSYREAHSQRGGQPEYVTSDKVAFYDVKVVRNPIVQV